MKLQKFRSGFGRVVNAVSYIGMVLLFAMVVIVAIDVILRKIGVGSIKGSNEMTTYFMVAICMLGIPALQQKDGHVWVNLLVNKFPYRFRCFWRCVIMALETLIVGLLVYGAWDKVTALYSRGTTTDILNWPKWIFAVAALVAFVEFFVLVLVDTIQLGIDGVKNEPPEPGSEGWKEDEVKGI